MSGAIGGAGRWAAGTGPGMRRCGFLVFTAGPVIAAGVISLLDWNLFSPPGFAGLDNFTRLGPDSTFWSAFGNRRAKAYAASAAVTVSRIVVPPAKMTVFSR
ncbi:MULTISPECIES: hypothetical protein [unclassified Streptomyces]|uniref:hypothetical protein n=1 Tax=unclassified Streptomyces TaxID=2593676 RepID=UPI00336A884F